MKIKEIEQHTGLTRSTIRYYEKEGLIFPDRLENGYRCYSEIDVLELRKINLLRRLGLSLENIKQIQRNLI